MKINNKIFRLKRFVKQIVIASEAWQSQRMARLKAGKPISLLLALTIILSLFLVAVPMAGIVEAVTPIYVDDTGGDDNYTGTTLGEAVKTIAKGIELVESGGTVYVAAGEYNEDVTINKSLTLISVGGKETTTINGQSTGYAILVDAGTSNVTIGDTGQGFTINGAGKAAMFLDTASGLTIRDNILVSPNSKPAFETTGLQSNHLIQGNTFQGDASQLVYVNGLISNNVDSTNVDFIGNLFSGTATGPALGQEATDSEISGNTFATVTGYASLELWGANNTVTGNNFTADLPTGGLYVLDNPATLDIGAVLSNNTFLRAVTVEHNSLLPKIWANIQDAVDEAVAGDTVDVAPGTYEEDVTLDKNVSIYGGSPKPTLKGTGAPVGPKKKGALSFAGPLEGITIKDIIIEYDGPLIDVPLMDAGYLSPVFNGVEFIGMEFIQRGTWTHTKYGGKFPINFGFGYPNSVEGAGVLFKDCVMTNASGQDGIFMTWEATGGGPTTFDNVTIDGNGYETQINIHDGIIVTVTDCHTMDNANFYLSGLTNLTVENNIFSGYGIFVNGVNGATIKDNVFENIRGLEFQAAWGPTQNYDVLVEGNTFQNIDGDAIKIHKYTKSTPDSDFLEVHYNNFIDTGGFALNNTFDTFTVNATENWWGDATGPYHATTNSPGQGNAVSDNVNFIPFLASSGGEVVNNVSITISGPTFANSGVDITYTITYKNIGTNYATKVVITEKYPPAVKFVSADPAPNKGGNNKWNIDDLAPGEGGTIKVTVRIK